MHVQILLKLSTFYGTVSDHNRTIVALKYGSAVTLSYHLQKPGLSVWNKALIEEGAKDALNKLHGMFIAHRNINRSNIMIVKRQGLRRLKGKFKIFFINFESGRMHDSRDYPDFAKDEQDLKHVLNEIFLS